MAEISNSRILTIPNLVSFARLLGVPVFLYLFLGTHAQGWAIAVLTRTMEVLQQEYSRAEQRQQFEELQGFLPGGHGSVSRSDLAAKRGVSVGAIDVAIHRLRQRFGKLLREQVAQTVSSEREVDEELHHLISVLGT